jgi:hypothetical protein
MIQIRYSPEPFVELDLQGSNAELAELRDSLHCFADGTEVEVKIDTDHQIDSSPYAHALKGLLVRRGADRIVLRVENDILILSGKPTYLRLFADNLPYDAEHTSSVDYHVHFDAAGREDHVAEESLDIVLSLRR